MKTPKTIAIPLSIFRLESECHACHFLKHEWHSMRADCTLFNSELDPITDCGVVVGFKPCNKCNELMNAANGKSP